VEDGRRVLKGKDFAVISDVQLSVDIAEFFFRRRFNGVPFEDIFRRKVALLPPVKISMDNHMMIAEIFIAGSPEFA
jgi:hypothetical protein